MNIFQVYNEKVNSDSGGRRIYNEVLSKLKNSKEAESEKIIVELFKKVLMDMIYYSINLRLPQKVDFHLDILLANPSIHRDLIFVEFTDEKMICGTAQTEKYNIEQKLKDNFYYSYEYVAFMWITGYRISFYFYLDKEDEVNVYLSSNNDEEKKYQKIIFKYLRGISEDDVEDGKKLENMIFKIKNWKEKLL